MKMVMEKSRSPWVLPIMLFSLKLRNESVSLGSPHFTVISAKYCECKIWAERRSWKLSGRHGKARKSFLQCQWNLESTQAVYISIYQKLAVIIFEAPDSIYCDRCIFYDRIIFCWPSYHCTIVYKRAFPYVFRIRGKDKADRATAEQVMDPRTRMILFKMLSRQLINEINGCISTGKEANVYHACTPTGQDRAIKVSPVTTRVTWYY